MSRRPRRLDLSAIAVDITPLRESPGYRALWVGQALSLMGTQMRQVAVPVQVFRLTGSNAAVGLIGLVELVPLIIFSIIGGTIADRFDRRIVMAWSQIGLMITSGALALVTFRGGATLAWIYGLTALSSAFASVDRPTRSAVLPHLVAPNQLSSAMALRQVLFQLTMIVGPLVAGVLIGVANLGVIYTIDAASFVAALVSVYWVPRLPVIVSEHTGWESVKEGLRYSFRTPIILAIFLTDLEAMIFGSPRALYPALAKTVFHRESLVGVLYAAPAVGAMLAALTTGWVERIERHGLAVIVSVLVWGVAIFGVGVCTFSLALTLLFLAIAGGADVVSAVFRGTMLIENSPDQLRGRTSAANLMVVTGGPRLGDLEGGLVAAAVGPAASITIGGAGCIVATLAIAARFKGYLGYKRSDARYREASAGRES